MPDERNSDRRVIPVTPMRVPSDPQAALLRETGAHTAKTIAAAYGTMIWDSFAAHALQGILAGTSITDLDEVARMAAQAADAMMEERQRRVESGRLRRKKHSGRSR